MGLFLFTGLRVCVGVAWFRLARLSPGWCLSQDVTSGSDNDE